ncbi:MAG: hypothetical protein K0R00_4083, partial [Herbinix sp.]|nr:hypothetical protein [Herbinix sp.]
HWQYITYMIVKNVYKVRCTRTNDSPIEYFIKIGLKFLLHNRKLYITIITL